MKKLLILAALLGVASVAHASNPSSSTELRTQRVVSQGANGTNTLTAFGIPNGYVSMGSDSNTVTSPSGVATYLWTTRSDSLLVLDWILVTGTAGAADEIWTVTIQDDNGVAMAGSPVASLTVTASTADYMPIPFPTGFPMFNCSTASSVVKTGTTPCSGNYNIVLAGATGANTMSIGFHMELPGDRSR